MIKRRIKGKIIEADVLKVMEYPIESCFEYAENNIYEMRIPSTYYFEGMMGFQVHYGKIVIKYTYKRNEHIETLFDCYCDRLLVSGDTIDILYNFASKKITLLHTA